MTTRARATSASRTRCRRRLRRTLQALSAFGQQLGEALLVLGPERRVTLVNPFLVTAPERRVSPLGVGHAVGLRVLGHQTQPVPVRLWCSGHRQTSTSPIQVPVGQTAGVLRG
jgi:hypothetical protein